MPIMPTSGVSKKLDWLSLVTIIVAFDRAISFNTENLQNYLHTIILQLADKYDELSKFNSLNFHHQQSRSD